MYKELSFTRLVDNISRSYKYIKFMTPILKAPTGALSNKTLVTCRTYNLGTHYLIPQFSVLSGLIL